jgi:hypothetical protein
MDLVSIAIPSNLAVLSDVSKLMLYPTLVLQYVLYNVLVLKQGQFSTQAVNLTSHISGASKPHGRILIQFAANDNLGKRCKNGW